MLQNVTVVSTALFPVFWRNERSLGSLRFGRPVIQENFGHVCREAIFGAHSPSQEVLS